MSDNPFFPHEPFTALTVFEASPVPTVIVEAKNYPMAELPSLFDSTFTGLFPALGAESIQPVAPPFSLYTRQPTDTVDIQVGIPVSTGLTRSLDLGNGLTAIPAELPAGSVAATTYTGGYDGLGEAWGTFMNTIVDAGHHPDLPFFEVYVTEPSPDSDPATLRTDLFVYLS